MPMPQQLWYLLRNGQQSGPFSPSDLLGLAQRGELSPDDFLWSEGMPAWQPVRGTKLAEAIPPPPKPPQPMPPPPPPMPVSSAPPVRSTPKDTLSQIFGQ